MREELIEIAMLKVLAVGTAGSSFMLAVFSPEATLPFFNVPITTLGMSAAGSLLGFAYGSPVDDRRKLFGYAIGGTFIGIWAVQILPKWLEWGWFLPELQPAVAGIVALLSRWIVPFVIEQIPALWKRIFGGNANSGDKQ